MMRILVTGGAGFIGSFIVDELVKKGHSVRIFDSLDPQVHPHGKAPEWLNKNSEFIQGDVRDYDSLKKAVDGMEVVFHHAAAVGVGQSQYQIKHYIDVNTGGTANLMDILANHKNSVKKVIVAASMSSYGEGSYHCENHGLVRPNPRPEEQMKKGNWEQTCPVCGKTVAPVPIREEDRMLISSIYALTKKDQEDIVMNIGKTYCIPCVSLRFFNVYGPRQSLSNPYTGVAAIFMSRIKNDHPPVVYEDGLQSRDLISVHDIVRANIMAMEKDEANYQIFNVGVQNPVTILDIARVLSRLYGKDIQPVIQNKYRKGDIRHCFADISKIKDKIGWRPLVNFEDGMKELIDWAHGAQAEDKFDTALKELKNKGLV
ncbi:MAG: SDR family NAD(P)-dependent oxidoreductase [Candidatus Aureabacteria bacterium]|nr:SDR family NAD(P)-dependent oxidoreductase [Candidatus Auribacterota bacterium]